MTKEELEKEAEEYAKKDCPDNFLCTRAIAKRGYLAGAEPREKRIAELEHQLTHRNCLDCSNHSSKLRMRTLELEKENAELKCECRRCVYTDSPCILSDYGKDKNGICDHFKDVFDENAELKERNRGLDAMLTGESLISNERKEQLTKAKELLKQLVDIEYAINIPKEKIISLRVKAEQFLSEVEK